ncbi:MAG: hypothetical protein ACUVTQ_10545 [Desulfotomaculales bacterium]
MTTLVAHMTGWYTVRGPTEEHWHLLWYGDRVVFRYAGECFRDFLIREEPARVAGGPPPPHPRDFVWPLASVVRVVLYRRRLLWLARLEIATHSERVVLFSRERGPRAVEQLRLLRGLLPPHIEVSIG